MKCFWELDELDFEETRVGDKGLIFLADAAAKFEYVRISHYVYIEIFNFIFLSSNFFGESSKFSDFSF